MPFSSTVTCSLSARRRPGGGRGRSGRGRSTCGIDRRLARRVDVGRTRHARRVRPSPRRRRRPFPVAVRARGWASASGWARGRRRGGRRRRRRSRRRRAGSASAAAVGVEDAFAVSSASKVTLCVLRQFDCTCAAITFSPTRSFEAGTVTVIEIRTCRRGLRGGGGVARVLISPVGRLRRTTSPPLTYDDDAVVGPRLQGDAAEPAPLSRVNDRVK